MTAGSWVWRNDARDIGTYKSSEYDMNPSRDQSVDGDREICTASAVRGWEQPEAVAEAACALFGLDRSSCHKNNSNSQCLDTTLVCFLLIQHTQKHYLGQRGRSAHCWGSNPTGSI